MFVVMLTVSPVETTAGDTEMVLLTCGFTAKTYTCIIPPQVCELSPEHASVQKPFSEFNVPLGLVSEQKHDIPTIEKLNAVQYCLYDTYLFQYNPTSPK